MLRYTKIEVVRRLKSIHNMYTGPCVVLNELYTIHERKPFSLWIFSELFFEGLHVIFHYFATLPGRELKKYFISVLCWYVFIIFTALVGLLCHRSWICWNIEKAVPKHTSSEEFQLALSLLAYQKKRPNFEECLVSHCYWIQFQIPPYHYFVRHPDPCA